MLREKSSLLGAEFGGGGGGRQQQGRAATDDDLCDRIRHDWFQRRDEAFLLRLPVPCPAPFSPRSRPAGTRLISDSSIATGCVFNVGFKKRSESSNTFWPTAASWEP